MRRWARVAPSLVAATLLGSAATFAWLGGGTKEHATIQETPPSPAPADLSLPPNHPPIPGTAAPSSEMSLPPNHPPLGGESPHGTTPAPSAEAPTLAWKMPADWQEEPNPSALRLATYRTPGGAEMSVARAGGTTEANIQRWRTQFDQAGEDKREEMTIQGMHVTVVRVLGTFEGSGTMMGGAPPQAHPGWGLLGAIVETSGSSYFFKLLGPATAITSARGSFDALLKSLKPN